jgi:hypothetical protein
LRDRIEREKIFDFHSQKKTRWNASKLAREFLDRLKRLESLSGKKAFAFDTKLKRKLAGTAGGR